LPEKSICILWVSKVSISNFKYAPTSKHPNTSILIAVFVVVIIIVFVVIIIIIVVAVIIVVVVGVVVSLLWSPGLGQRVVLSVGTNVSEGHAATISNSTFNVETQSSSDESMPNQHQSTIYRNTHGHSMNLHHRGNFR
jgi:hypothetical protein